MHGTFVKPLRRSGIDHTVFTARRVCIARTMPWQHVCPSVCHTPALSFSPSGSLTILIFPHQAGWQYSDGDPCNGASSARGMKINHDFRPISIALSRKWCKIEHSYYGRRIGNRSQAFEQYRFEWSWVTSNPDFKMHDIQRQITKKKVPDRAICTMADQQKVVCALSNGAVLNDFEHPYPRFQGHAILWRWISQKRYKIQL